MKTVIWRGMKTVICKSGIQGWQSKLQKVYRSLGELEHYDKTFNIVKRLGYKSAKTAWKANPTIQGSVLPSDFRKIRTA